MRKIIILIPVFNDWESLKKLIYEISEIIKDIKDIHIDCIIINDASTINQPTISKPENIRSLRILNMKKNQGHARCNAFAIRFINMNEKFDNLILMDGDGEDRPIEIKSLINEIIKNPNNSVVAKRVKRSEGLFFQFLYQMHKIITFVFTVKKINFGNYSCLTKKDVKEISSKASLWSSFSGTVKKNLKNLGEIDSIRGSRYFGPSKMSIYKLLIHSFSIIAVFKKQVLIRSVIFFSFLYFLKDYLGNATIIAQSTIVIFNFLIFLVSLRENKEELINSQDNLRDIRDLTH